MAIKAWDQGPWNVDQLLDHVLAEIDQLMRDTGVTNLTMSELHDLVNQVRAEAHQRLKRADDAHAQNAIADQLRYGAPRG